MRAGSGGGEAMADVLNRLKEQLREANYSNIGNLTALNSNIQFLFAYASDAFLIIIREKQALQQRIAFLQNQIAKYGLEFILQEQANQHQHQAFHSEHSSGLDALNTRMRDAIIQKAQLEGIRRESDVRTHRSRSTRTAPSEKRQASQEFNRAIGFVREHLADKLEDEPSKAVELPKNAILNLYLRWSQRQGQPVEYQSLSSLQMALTNEIKRHFPQCSHNSRSFRGIQFKQQYAPLLRSDVKPSERKAGEESEEESPPLPSFPDDHLAV